MTAERPLGSAGRAPSATADGRVPARQDAQPGGELRFEAISHHYPSSGGARIDVLSEVTFDVPAGTVACVVGPSGCGKSTLLGLAAGLIVPAAGSVRWDGSVVGPGPNHHLGMAFQQPGLFPWMSVRENVAIGLRTRGHDRATSRRVAGEFIALVGLADFADAYPNQLSGGMAQRVGIARALALRPRLLLMDEPFASVDAFTRLKLQQEFKALLKLHRPTVLFVTHDVSEAILLGDVIVVMSQRPASIVRRIRVEREARDRGSAAYAHKLAETLECLGVDSDAGPE
jgi:ABC-type nitrate/sulfonate/bicarbonate transport system ATPase subunit